MTHPTAPNAATYGLRLAKALANTGKEVTVFLMADAVGCAKAGQKVPKGFYNLELMVKSVARKGKVLSCVACKDARALNMDEPAERAMSADRLLVF